MKKKCRLFIDGAQGTTGLELRRRVEAFNRRSETEVFELLTIEAEKKKNPEARKKLYLKAEVVALCLADEAAQQAVAVLKNLTIPPKVLDASSAHRVAEGWEYGLVEIKGARARLRKAQLVSNPGCYASGFILLMRPLIEKKLLPPDFLSYVWGVSGYSGGGRALIQHYEAEDKFLPFAPYALTLRHKHLKEMQRYSLLRHPPLFQPAVEHTYRGMVVGVPLHQQVLQQASLTLEKIAAVLLDYYAQEERVRVKTLAEEELLEGKFLNFCVNNNSDTVDLLVGGSERSGGALYARLDNLGKGAAGTALENLKLMSGFTSPLE